MKTTFLSMVLLFLIGCGETQSVSEVDDVFFHGKPKPQELNMIKLKDGTISWEQPDSTGLGNYNGYCGETAWANLASMYLKKKVSPFLFHDYSIGVDITPGTQPETIKSGLENITKKTVWTWKKLNADPSNAITKLEYSVLGYSINRTHLAKNKKLRKRYPVAVLISPKKNRLHWVTVVDVTTDKGGNKTIVFNEYGKQNSLPANIFHKQWNYTKRNGIIGRLVSATRTFGNMAYIVPKVRL